MAATTKGGRAAHTTGRYRTGETVPELGRWGAKTVRKRGTVQVDSKRGESAATVGGATRGWTES